MEIKLDLGSVSNLEKNLKIEIYREVERDRDILGNNNRKCVFSI